jgi:hypothetical protein
MGHPQGYLYRSPQGGSMNGVMTMIAVSFFSALTYGFYWLASNMSAWVTAQPYGAGAAGLFWILAALCALCALLCLISPFLGPARRNAVRVMNKDCRIAGKEEERKD